MIFIDKYAYSSKLKNTDPALKLAFAVMTLAVCIWAERNTVSVAVVFLMAGITVLRGGTPLRFYLRLVLVPVSFLLIGAITVAVSIAHEKELLLPVVSVAGKWIGFSAAGLKASLQLFLKALGAVSCMYFLALSTSMVDLLSALRRLKIPGLLVELMGLVYRFAFVLLETAGTIYNAQSCRLGYSSLKSSYRSLGALAAMLFVRSYRQSDALYTALEARGYDGGLNVLSEPYESHWSWYVMAAAVNALLVMLAAVIKSTAGGSLL